MVEKVINMEPLEKSIQQEPRLLNKPKRLKPAKQPLKRKSDLNETIAVTSKEVMAIHQKQCQQRFERLLEIEAILIREIERCRKLTQLMQD